MANRMTLIRRLAVAIPLTAIVLAALALWHFAPRANPQATAADYSLPANWLCRPGRADACATDLTATAIAADGSTSTLSAKTPADPGFDCFYVYPTVSRDPRENAPLGETNAETEVAATQFARFRTICRTYAPLYRQVTLRSITFNALNLGHFGSFPMAYADIRAAWQHYLAHDNNGRGVVLIGHSQGSRMIKQLLQEEIENKPAQSRLILALLTGNSLKLPAGKTTGGDFKSLPICTKPAQFGCVIAYSSFRASAPPPLNPQNAGKPGFYGVDPDRGTQLACTNPAALAGGKAVLDAYLPTRIATTTTPWTNPPTPIDTAFVTVPGLISGECIHADGRSYLAITFNGAPTDRRRNNINGDIVVLGKIQSNWGLHLLDVNLVQGDLIRAAQLAAEAFGRK